MADDELAAVQADVLPLVQAAIAARIAHDHMGAVLALGKLFQLDELRVYSAFGGLTGAARAAVPPRTVPGETWTPDLIAGTPPTILDPNTDPAARFVLAYLAAYVRQDPHAAAELWCAFNDRPLGTPEELAAVRRDVSLAFVLMLQLAARGTQITLERKQRPANRHPGARRRSPRRPRRQR